MRNIVVSVLACGLLAASPALRADETVTKTTESKKKSGKTLTGDNKTEVETKSETKTDRDGTGADTKQSRKVKKTTKTDPKTGDTETKTETKTENKGAK